MELFYSRRVGEYIESKLQMEMYARNMPPSLKTSFLDRYRTWNLKTNCQVHLNRINHEIINYLIKYVPDNNNDDGDDIYSSSEELNGSNTDCSDESKDSSEEEVKSNEGADDETGNQQEEISEISSECMWDPRGVPEDLTYTPREPSKCRVTPESSEKGDEEHIGSYNRSR